MKKQTNYSEVLFYLEEMIDLDLATDCEKDVYYDIKWRNKVSRHKLNKVMKNMDKWYDTAF